MNKYLFFSLLVSVLAGSEGCRRNAMPRASGSTAAQSPASDTTGSMPKMAGTSPGSATTTASGSVPEEAHASVAAVNFRYLTARSKISFKSEKQEIDNASVTIRIQQDSLIWLSISKLGIEAARVRITRDSIMILDKLNRSYAVADFATLSRQFSFSLSYPLIQALIVGNLPLPDRIAQKSKSAGDTNYQVLRQQEGPVSVENYVDETDRKLKKLVMTQRSANNTLRVTYADFAPLKSFLFPLSSVVMLDYRSQTDGHLSRTVLRSKYDKVELIDKNPGFPFTVPATYQRRPYEYSLVLGLCIPIVYRLPGFCSGPLSTSRCSVWYGVPIQHGHSKHSGAARFWRKKRSKIWKK